MLSLVRNIKRPVARITQDTDPRVMRVLLPNINCKGEIVLRNGGQNLKEEATVFNSRDKDGYIVPPVSPLDLHDDDKFQILGNKSPTFTRGSYRLNFGGRVLLPSVKNFQLCEVNACKIKKDVEVTDLSDIMLQFEKLRKRFSLDFKESMTPFQAFGLMLHSSISDFNCIFKVRFAVLVDILFGSLN